MLASSAPWTSWPRSSASIRSSCASATSPTVDPEKGVPFSTRQLVALPAARAPQPLRLGPAQPDAGPGARRPLAGRHGHGRRHPRQLPAAGQVPASRSTRDGVLTVAHGDDRHRHRHLHHPDPDRRRDAGPAARAGARRARRQRLPAGAGLRRLVRRGERRLGARSTPARTCARKLAQARRHRSGAGDVRATARSSGVGKTRARWRSLAGAQGLSAEGEITPGDMGKKYSQQTYGAHFAEVGVDADTGEVRAAPHAGRVRRRPHPQRQDRAQPADRRHDLGRRHGAARGGGASTRATAPSSTRTWPSTTCRCTPTSGDRRRVPARGRRQGQSAEDQGRRRAGHLRRRRGGGQRHLQRHAACACATTRSRWTRCCAGL